MILGSLCTGNYTSICPGKNRNMLVKNMSLSVLQVSTSLGKDVRFLHLLTQEIQISLPIVTLIYIAKDFFKWKIISPKDINYCNSFTLSQISSDKSPVTHLVTFLSLLLFFILWLYLIHLA